MVAGLADAGPVKSGKSEAMDPDHDPARFATHVTDRRGFDQAYVREGAGGVPLLLVHGWPESKRIWWRVIEPLSAAGFDVIVPDLRGFGDSEPGPPGDGYGDVPSHSRDLHALLTDELGHERVIVAGGDLGGPVVQDLALRFPDVVERLVLFNSPLPFDKARMAGMRTRPPSESGDYFIRQATDADGLAADLATAEQRRRYIATFYTSRFWSRPGAFAYDPMAAAASPFGGGTVVDFHTEPYGDATSFRATLRSYESALAADAQSEPTLLARNPDVEALLLFGTDDHVLYPDFDRMAAQVFPDHVGPFLLRDCGHFVPWEAPGPFTSAVRSFCRDLLPSPDSGRARR